MMVHTFIPSTQKAEAGVQEQPRPNSEILYQKQTGRKEGRKEKENVDSFRVFLGRWILGNRKKKLEILNF